MIGASLKIVAEFLGWTNRRDELANTPEMKAAAKAAREQAELDRETKAVKDRDEKAVRENLS